MNLKDEMIVRGLTSESIVYKPKIDPDIRLSIRRILYRRDLGKNEKYIG